MPVSHGVGWISKIVISGIARRSPFSRVCEERTPPLTTKRLSVWIGQPDAPAC